MIIGIVSDTHGQERRLGAAIEVIVGRGASTIVHCGDIGSDACVEALGDCGLACYLVAGNMDRDVESLARLTDRCGVAFVPTLINVPLGDGRLLAATHGDDRNLLSELIRRQKHAYVCHGHSHQWRDERIGPVRVINPGALQRAAVHTLAILDTAADRLEQIAVP